MFAMDSGDLCRFCEAAEEVVLVAPYMKENEVETIAMNRYAKAFDGIRACMRGSVQDFLAGSSDEIVISRVSGLGGEMFICPSLHAKYYRADDRWLIGSANLSRRGMSGEDFNGNIEILVEATDFFDGPAFEKHLWKRSFQVDSTYMDVLGDLMGPFGSVIEERSFQGDLMLNVPGMERLDEDDLSLDGWSPESAHVAYLWDGYRSKMADVPIEAQREAVAGDLFSLRLPVGLDRKAFDAWVKSVLLTFPETARPIMEFLRDPAYLKTVSDPRILRTLDWWSELNATADFQLRGESTKST